jgi:methionyl-tRNA formyltransferase
MKILLLGPYRQKLVKFLESFDDEVLITEKRTEDEPELLKEADFLISYGYRHIIKDSLLRKFPRRAINLHISYLPWNRGADPNLWSFLEDSPKGVTIHFMDARIDTGEIIAQRQVSFGENETLRTTYDKLTISIESLLREVWPEVRAGKCKSFRQPSGGSYHRVRDKTIFKDLLRDGWDTPVAEIAARAKKQTAEE